MSDDDNKVMTNTEQHSCVSSYMTMSSTRTRYNNNQLSEANLQPFQENNISGSLITLNSV